MDDPCNDRRFRRLLITPAFLVLLCKQKRLNIETVENGLPADAEARGTVYDGNTNSFAVLVHSREFSPVPVGEIIPALPDPVFRRLEP